MPWRDCDNPLGIKRNGALPPAVIEANLESEHATMVADAVASEGGFVLAETPARRVGPKAWPAHVLADCTRAVHMYDHDAWRRFSVKHGASEHIWDQCLKADNPASVAVKSSVWLATPNISSIVVEE